MPPYKLPLGIAYDDSGTGIPTVFVHGFPLSRTMWRPQISGLSQLCRCIVPDLRGFGESVVEGPYSMDRYADDIAELLDACSVRRAVIAGCSMGGYVAFAFWRRHRERVLGLALCDTRPGADGDAALEKRRAMIHAARTDGSAAVADMMIGSLLGPTTRERCPEVEHEVRAMMTGAPVDGVTGAIEAMMQRPDSTPALTTIDVPTVVITGENDAIVPVSEARAMSDAIRHSFFEVLPSAGHLSNLERPAAFNTVFSEFLAQLRTD
ncbi:MAG TPA: alpha/beta fold hydrolase [Gemmatimonadaceae bacterium]|nr:alpha/beta fold hydrolase [Gemmatimonadaceae bacterium]